MKSRLMRNLTLGYKYLDKIFNILMLGFTGSTQATGDRTTKP
ncbi:MAG: hypothetical protein ACFBSC_18040 [Microcoleaceae cyanobacterium]